MAHTKPRTRALGKGDEVVAQPGRIHDAGPFDKLVVVRVHKDGTLDLKSAIRGDQRRWERVDADAVVTIAA